jgi:hypothetical protein
MASQEDRKPGPVTWAVPGAKWQALLIAVSLVFCLALVDRHQLMNGFSMLPGDRYDSVIAATLLEHWYRVFCGDARWLDAGYFFPYQRTIAHTDGHFLVGLAYVPFRALRLDPFISTELAALAIKSVGFAGCYLLCRRVFALSFWWALLAAVLFTLNNAMTIHGYRVQLATVAMAPVMALLVWSAAQAFLAGNASRFRTCGVAAAVLFGAWCITCFYMAWFFAFFSTTFMAAALVLAGVPGLALVKQRIAAQAGSVALVATAAVASIGPFVYAYLPKSQETGVRPYSLAWSHTIPPEEILQVGEGNILLGPLYRRFLSLVSPDYAPHGEYYNTGVALLLFVLFALGCVQVLRLRRKSGEGLLLPCTVIATLATWLLALNLRGHSAWFFVYEFFPGAKALSVVSSYQMFLALPVVLVGVAYLSRRQLAPTFLLVLSALLVAEELNRPYMELERRAEIERAALPHEAPRQCKAFYVSGWPNQAGLTRFPAAVNTSYAHNVTAMLIAQNAGIPTLNGVASFNPPDWDFDDPNKPDYDQRVLVYARRHGVTSLCRLDLDSKRWSVVD